MILCYGAGAMSVPREEPYFALGVDLEMSQIEIAELLGITRTAISRLIQRGRELEKKLGIRLPDAR